MLTFSLIIPVKPGGTTKALYALMQLKGQVYPYEILIAEGTSPSRQRNLAAEQARGDILYFLDDDSCVVPDCMTQCAQAFGDLSVAVVGGPSLTPDSDSRLQHIFAYALTTSFGSGAMRNRYRAAGRSRITTERELILCNMAIRRDLFLAAGGFDERLYPNEENELLDRIISLGHNLVHVPSMAVMRSQRTTLAAFVRQMFSYGRGRAQQTIIARSCSFMSFMPLILLIYVALLPLLPANMLWKLPLVSYIALDIVFTIVTLLKTGRPETLFLFGLYPLMHCANGAGLLYGFVKGKPVAKTGSDVTIRRVREFEQPTDTVP
ncbi:MAG: glycosyl transferase family 2 [Desulfuromonadales bacterium GWD2_54_10]|nr:MAG: glycosyl transferase family 2 [Desulfuromonadales bacterium GWD2_54_10]